MVVSVHWFSTTLCSSRTTPDKQTATQTIDPNGFLVPRVSNASSAKAVGLELEFAWATPVEGLSLNLGLTLLDTEYEDFIDLTTSRSAHCRLR